MKKEIFISYSREDKDVVFPFVKRVEKELGSICWIDYEGIESGAQFEDVIVDAIEESKVMLFMLSDNSIESKWTKREVLYAEGDGKRIVPVVVDGKGLRKWFRFHFGNIDYIDIHIEEQCDKLLNDLAAWIGLKRTAMNESTLDKNMKIKISLDKPVITLSIPGGFYLELKREYDRDCYVGEIPLQEILEKIVGGKIGATIESNVNGVCGVVGIGWTGSLAKVGWAGKIAGEIVGKSLYDKYQMRKEDTFNAVISELNRKYGIVLRKKTKNISDYRVEMDASEISKVMQMM